VILERSALVVSSTTNTDTVVESKSRVGGQKAIILPRVTVRSREMYAVGNKTPAWRTEMCMHLEKMSTYCSGGLLTVEVDVMLVFGFGHLAESSTRCANLFLRHMQGSCTPIVDLRLRNFYGR
jgi:hypothetical protein